MSSLVSAEPDALPAREAAKRATRQALVRAAREAFAEQGLEGPSLDAICARAGFTRGAFYVHFESREDLLAAVMEEVLGEVVDGVLGREGAEDDLEATVARYVGVARFRRAAGAAGVPFHQVLDACARSPRLAKKLASLLTDARTRLERAARADQRAGRATRAVPSAELANLLLLLALGLVVAEDLAIDLDLDASRAALRRWLRA
jgi:AcrR family transcriptional regulator